MSVEGNKATVRRWFECWNRADLPGLEACCTPQTWETWREFQKDAVARWHTAFPDYCYHVENLVAEGDIVAVDTLSSGTHDGVFQWAAYGPWPASGKQISMREIFFVRMSNGQIAEMSAVWNPDDLRQQLGVPVPQASAAS